MKGKEEREQNLAREVVFSSVKEFGVAAVDETILLHAVAVQVDEQDWQRPRNVSFCVSWSTQRLRYHTKLRSTHEFRRVKQRPAKLFSTGFRAV